MGSKDIKHRRLTFEKPWIRKRPRPPKSRTLIGESFSSANYNGVLFLQHCEECATINYPPRQRCLNCLGDELIWRETDCHGEILSITELFHSQWEFFKRKISDKPWPIATVQVADRQMFAHLALHTFTGVTGSVGLERTASLTEALPKGTPIKVFTQADSSYKSVLIAVSADTPVEQVSQRVEIIDTLGLR